MPEDSSEAAGEADAAAELARLRQELSQSRRDALLCRAILESATDYAILTLDEAGRVTSWNSGAEALLGWTAAEARGLDSRVLFTPEDRERRAPEAEMAEARKMGRAEDQRWHLRKDGSRFWGSGLLMPIRDDVPPGFLKIMRDRTVQREASERQGLLLRELAHRVKNSLALILSMARQTSLRAEDLDGFLSVFEGRLRALALAHDLLTDSGWTALPLRALARTTLAPHDPGGDRLKVQVADTPLHPALAQDLVLALHELATNATKHGALSSPQGEVVLESREAGSRLVLTWAERGGPKAAPPARRGFGTTLLERVVAHQHQGEVTLDWQPEGLVCTMRLPRAKPGG